MPSSKPEDKTISQTITRGLTGSENNTKYETTKKDLIKPLEKIGVIGLQPDLSKLHIINTNTADSARAIFGETTAATGRTDGVVGMHTASGNYGVLGGSLVGVYGVHEQAQTSGVIGAGNCGVGGYNQNSHNYGELGTEASGVAGYGYNTANTFCSGVFGQFKGGNYGKLGTEKSGVYGSGYPYAGYFDGPVYARGYPYAGDFGGGPVHAQSLEVTGTKKFVVPDPADPGREICYSCIEGPEAATYIRGIAQIVNGQTTIQLPGHFAKVTSEQGITIQLTPVGKWLQLYVLEKSTSTVTIAEATGQSGNFDYFIQGIRKGYENFEVERPRTATPQAKDP
ncbi:MAG: hypothetical protein NT082_07075 [Chloroflexi bacterium]|nr:hypothetical protein [Chloroflexota bacterium]